MNVFEKTGANVEAFMEGYKLLQQAGLPVEARFSFNFEEKDAMKAVFEGKDPYVSPAFGGVPMWFIRAMRKHRKVYSWNSYGHTGRAWVDRYSDGSIKIKPWDLDGGRAFNAEVTLECEGGQLVFFFTMKQGK